MSKESAASLLSPEQRQVLEEVAAASAAIALYARGKEEILAVIPTRKAGRYSPWSLAGRQELMIQRG